MDERMAGSSSREVKNKLFQGAVWDEQRHPCCKRTGALKNAKGEDRPDGSRPIGWHKIDSGKLSIPGTVGNEILENPFLRTSISIKELYRSIMGQVVTLTFVAYFLIKATRLPNQPNFLTSRRRKVQAGHLRYLKSCVGPQAIRGPHEHPHIYICMTWVPLVKENEHD